MKCRPFRDKKFNWPEGALIARRIGISQGLKNHLCTDHYAVAARIGWSVVFRRIVPQVDDKFGRRNRNFCVVENTVVLLLGQFESSVGQFL